MDLASVLLVDSLTTLENVKLVFQAALNALHHLTVKLVKFLFYSKLTHVSIDVALDIIRMDLSVLPALKVVLVVQDLTSV